MTSTSVYFPGKEPWYDVVTLERFQGPGSVTVQAPLHKIPVFQRGGSIIPRKLRLRRSSKLMVHDPYTLVVALDKKGTAEGSLYMDDEHTLKYLQGQYAVRKYSLEKGLLKSERVEGSAGLSFENAVERIMVVGQASKPGNVLATVGGVTRTLDFEYDGKAKVLVIRKPGVLADADWTISLK